ncbi:hypothetical protein SAMN05660976_08170 [Nonomuraea pusilla]|uniref:Uncharacterized protein n=1 Tax=Nonomuraea pusilla TaxID=46177 RepID=A0A1H8IW02_9ACTN|nr:hypothetical protein SAMN05660976_08170 [Nonomuraea pusilla]
MVTQDRSVAQLSASSGRDRCSSQADSAGSILVTRSQSGKVGCRRWTRRSNLLFLLVVPLLNHPWLFFRGSTRGVPTRERRGFGHARIEIHDVSNVADCRSIRVTGVGDVIANEPVVLIVVNHDERGQLAGDHRPLYDGPEAGRERVIGKREGDVPQGLAHIAQSASHVDEHNGWVGTQRLVAEASGAHKQAMVAGRFPGATLGATRTDDHELRRTETNGEGAGRRGGGHLRTPTKIVWRPCRQKARRRQPWLYSHEYSQEGEHRRNSANIHGHRTPRSGPPSLIEASSFNP